MSRRINKNINVVILCGGLGTRLRPVIADQPKVLAHIGEEPLLKLLLERLSSAGFKRIILCVGYLKKKVKEYVRNKNIRDKNLEIVFSEEVNPLGTGGALKKALGLVRSDNFLVMNGDTLVPVNFRSFYNFHRKNHALLSLILTRGSSKAGGNLKINKTGRVISFQEKKEIVKDKNPFLSAGVYLMHRSISSYFPSKRSFSLEYELFPKLVGERFYGFPIQEKFLDIGTPAGYFKALSLFQKPQRAVFLDRDGVITKEPPFYAHQPEQLKLIPKVTRVIKLLNEKKIKVVVVSNQAGVGKGYFPEEAALNFSSLMRQRLAQKGARIDAIYHCFHHPGAKIKKYRKACDCRKPRPGMIQKAAAELNLDLKRSFLIGDKISDIRAGKAAGCRTILVKTGQGLGEFNKLKTAKTRPEYIADDLYDSIKYLA